jgi:hypothetical protein
MNALNFYPNAINGANVGISQANFDFKNIVGFAIVPAGTVFSQTQTATPAAFFTAMVAATSAVKTARLYPVNNMAEIKDGSENAVEEKLGYGQTLTVRDGAFKWSYRIIKGGFWLSRALRAFNAVNVDVLFIDSSNLVIGSKNVSSAGVVTYGGFPQYQAYNEPLKINDGAKNTIYMQNFAFPGNSFDTLGFVQLNAGDFNNVLGLQDITLTSATRTTNVSVIGGTIGHLGASLGQTIGSALAIANLWILQDSVTGTYFNASTGITSVAYSATTGLYTITANAADPAYNVGNPVIVSLAAASILDGAGLHYESNNIITAS